MVASFVSKSSCCFQICDATSFLSLGEGKRETLRPSVIPNLLILFIYIKPLPGNGKMIDRKGRGKKREKRREWWGRGKLFACSWDSEIPDLYHVNHIYQSGFGSKDRSSNISSGPQNYSFSWLFLTSYFLVMNIQLFVTILVLFKCIV